MNEMTSGDMMADSMGRLVPRNLVKPEDLLQDELVRKLHVQAVALNAQISEVKTAAFAEVESYLNLLRQQYGVTQGGVQGNVTLASYDGSLRIVIQVGKMITFGPELQVAKEKIDQCLLRWAEGANDNIRALVMDAFQVEKGRLNADRILSLLKLAIDDPDWKTAMEAIQASISRQVTKPYMRFYRRVSGHGAKATYEPVLLDIAKV